MKTYIDQTSAMCGAVVVAAAAT
ncbi:MAG: hypothetical protein RLZZ265_2176, partial [Verrucomicrobiota bacterium]